MTVKAIFLVAALVLFILAALNVPSTKIQTRIHAGCPAEEIHNPQSVGHNSRRMPMGLSRRMSRS